MLVFLNGKFIPEEQASVSVFDRSFCLGDGLFEAIPIYNGKAFLVQKYLARLQAGADFLKIKLPFTPMQMVAWMEELFRKNEMPNGILRLQLSRGVGRRGYSPEGATSPFLVMTSHPFRTSESVSCKIIISSVRVLANDPLARFKTSSKLSYIVARAEADAQSADEAMLRNQLDNIVEATSSNFFWIENQTVCTPPVSSGALPGVTREVVLELCRKLQINRAEKNLPWKNLSLVSSAFLTSSGFGIRAVTQIDAREIPGSPIITKLRDALCVMLKIRIKPHGFAA